MRGWGWIKGSLFTDRGVLEKPSTPQTDAASNDIVLLVQSSISTRFHIEG